MASDVLRIPGAWRIFACASSGEISGDQVVEWAIRALELGWDTPHLRQLAAFDTPTSWFAVERTLTVALREMGVRESVSEEEARRYHAREVAQAIIDGRMTPEAGALEIEETVVSPLGHPDDLVIWCTFSDCRFCGPTWSQGVDTLILEEARRLLERG